MTSAAADNLTHGNFITTNYIVVEQTNERELIEKHKRNKVVSIYLSV